jgi:hypothetical protein
MSYGVNNMWAKYSAKGIIACSKTSLPIDMNPTVADGSQSCRCSKNKATTYAMKGKKTEVIVPVTLKTGLYCNSSNAPPLTSVKVNKQ